MVSCDADAEKCVIEVAMLLHEISRRKCKIMVKLCVSVYSCIHFFARGVTHDLMRMMVGSIVKENTEASFKFAWTSRGSELFEGRKMFILMQRNFTLFGIMYHI